MTELTSGSPAFTPTFFARLPSKLQLTGSVVENVLLPEYGGIFATSATPPDRLIFADENDVERFQSSLDVMEARIGEYSLQLQRPAMEMLLAAINNAEDAGLSITPRGPDAAGRSYGDTVSLWASRVEPALDHWCAQGRLELDDARRIRSLSAFEQVEEVLRYESQGIFFAKDLSKSIIYSVAPPGASQHLSLLAFDVAEFESQAVRRIMENHGWFQTVVSDLPHFTYLGRSCDDLEAFDLKKVEFRGQEFWVPAI